MRDNFIRHNVLFIEACRKSKGVFAEWVESCSEEDLKLYFGQMAQIRDHVDASLKVAEGIRDGI
jgi:hypothetical protein